MTEEKTSFLTKAFALEAARIVSVAGILTSMYNFMIGTVDEFAPSMDLTAIQFLSNKGMLWCFGSSVALLYATAAEMFFTHGETSKTKPVVSEAVGENKCV